MQNEIGFISYHTLSSSFVAEATANAVLDSHGFSGYYISAVPMRVTFKERCRALKSRYLVHELKRKLFTLELPETDDTTAFAIHIGKTDGARSHSLAQLGIIELDRKASKVRWTLNETRRNGEGLAEYQERCLLTVGAIVQLEDLQAVTAVCSDIKTRVESEGDKVNNHQVHKFIRRIMLEREMNVVQLRPTGGIYFVPNIPARGDENPADIMRRLASVVAELGQNTMFMVPQFAEPGTVQAVRAAATESISSKIADIERELDNAERITRQSTLARRLNSIKDLLSTADMYSDLVQLKHDAFSERIAKLRTHITELLTSDEPEPEAKPSITRVQIRVAARSAKREGAASKGEGVTTVGDVTIAYNDGTYTWSIGDASGVVTTQGALVKAIIASVSN